MNVFQELFDHYNEFHVDEIDTNRFSSEKFHQVLDSLTADFEISLLGNSVEGRPIKSITLGDGPIKVLLWSQMHGNESTASRAILDILQFFNQPGGLAEVAAMLHERLTIKIVPILNPDGTNAFQRRNALNIDLNRDARAFVAPESRILKSIVEEFKPQFAFNLHDQRRFYNITGTKEPSTISFLAPAYDRTEGVSASRGEAMKLIAKLRNTLETVIPGQVGIYNDDYSPRAFGDYVQGTGASTILVESGWQHEDMQKEHVRKLNFCLLVSAFHSIAERKHENLTIDDYRRIPKNDERLFDLLLKNVMLTKGDGRYAVDIGISRSEISVGDTSYYAVGQIDEIGDLDGWYGFDELAGEGLEIHPGLVWPEVIADLDAITNNKAVEWLKQGYLFAKVQQNCTEKFVNLPMNVVNDDFTPEIRPHFEGKANFLLKTPQGALKYVIINGFLWNLDNPISDSINGLRI